MGTTEDVARLILEADTKGFAESQAKIDATKIALEMLTASYKAGAVDINFYLEMGEKLQGELDDLTASYKAASDAAKKYGSNAAAAAALANPALQATGERSQAAARGVLELSRGIEDLATGGPIGLLNNVPGIFQSIGGAIGVSGAALGTLTAGVSFAATGAYVLYRNWDMVTGLWETRNPFPKAARDIEGLKDEVEKAKDELKKMEEAGSGTAKQLERYNELRAKTRDIEQQITEEMEIQKGLETLRKIDPDKEHTDQRAKILKEGVAGQGFDSDDLVSSVTDALRADIHKQRNTLNQQIGAMAPGEDRNKLGMMALDLGNRLNDPQQLSKDAKKLVEQAVNQGQVGAAQEIRNLMQRVPEKFIPEHVTAFDKAQDVETDKEKKAKEKKEKDALDAAAAIDKDNAAQSKAGMEVIRKRENAIIDRLNAQGKEGEAEALKENRAIAKEKADALKADQKLLEEQIKGAKEATDAKEKALRATSLDEEAAAEAARLRTTGMSPEQQQAMLRRQIGQRVGAAFPGMGAMEQGALTNRFAQGAGRQVDDQMAGMMGDGMNQQQAAIEVAAETQAIVAQLLAKQRGIGNAIGQLRQNNQNLRRQVEMPGNWNGNPMGGD